jgi:hypothetical protein
MAWHAPSIQEVLAAGAALLLRYVRHDFVDMSAAPAPGDAVALPTHRWTAHVHSSWLVRPLFTARELYPRGYLSAKTAVAAGLDVVAARTHVLAAPAFKCDRFASGARPRITHHGSSIEDHRRICRISECPRVAGRIACRPCPLRMIASCTRVGQWRQPAVRLSSRNLLAWLVAAHGNCSVISVPWSEHRRGRMARPFALHALVLPCNVLTEFLTPFTPPVMDLFARSMRRRVDVLE